jgi:phospholipid-translocating ATPase
LQDIIIGYAILFNNVIPLSLYVSLEIVKIGQMIMLNSDIDMYDDTSDIPARCNTNTILENLGQIGYIFSDKTGTLTENVMTFRKMSIAGTTWLHEVDMKKKAQDVDLAGGQLNVNSDKGLEHDESHTPSVISPTNARVIRGSSSHWRSTGRPDHIQPERTTEDLLRGIRLRPGSPFAIKATQYILALALCHTCLPEIKGGKVDFQGSSPDELALVRAAQEMGFVVTQRSRQSITLTIPDADGNSTQRVYEILDVIEFTTERKRMSAIVRCPGGEIWLISKGADSVILPRLKLAHLAVQKANEIRRSLEAEHEIRRRSRAGESRVGRTSQTIRRSLALHSSAADPGKHMDPSPSESFDNSSKFPQSHDSYQLSVDIRTKSPDVPDTETAVSPPSRPAAPSTVDFFGEAMAFDDAEVFTRCFKHLNEFASEGLRTLLFAQKFLSEEEYKSWKTLYHEAETSLTNRQERIEAAAELIESSLDLVGASAIEDKLQAGVPETMDRLHRANIKIWMLTGDKRETALNIAHSARICRPGSDIFTLDVTKGDLETQLLEIQGLVELRSERGLPGGGAADTVVVIDGHTLSAIEQLANTRLHRLFFGLVPAIDSVICCRASPAQKALLVRTIRNSGSLPTSCCTLSNSVGPLTLAIGDGANDLAMIAEAHVGIGISGREGLQAARVADYSIAQFRFLSKLLLVHGRWNYSRTARFILATFWKEMFFYLSTTMYQRYNGYTGTSLYENWSLTVLNTLFTSLCVIVSGIWEQELQATTLLAVPELYVYGQKDRGLNLGNYLWWMAGAVFQGLLTWFGCWAGYGGIWLVRDNGLFALGDLAFSVGILWTNFKLM